MNVDPTELEKFNSLAHRWWDPASEFRPLHEINTLRITWINAQASISGKKVADIGCGGGILSEAMSTCGADVVGIDLADKPLRIAELHSIESGVRVQYEKISAELLALREPSCFDVVTCMEMLEHVPDPLSTIKACASLVKPGGHLFFSTINRNFKAYLFAVIGAEYLLRLLPKGTHDYAKFITPAELTKYMRDAGVELQAIKGLGYNPFSKTYALNDNTDVNYMISAVRLR